MNEYTAWGNAYDTRWPETNIYDEYGGPSEKMRVAILETIWSSQGSLQDRGFHPQCRADMYDFPTIRSLEFCSTCEERTVYAFFEEPCYLDLRRNDRTLPFWNSYIPKASAAFRINCTVTINSTDPKFESVSTSIQVGHSYSTGLPPNSSILSVYQ